MEDRWFKYVDIRWEGCWLWVGHTANGYGYLTELGRSVRAHRLAYEMVRGPIPEGLELDHLCCNKACVNPGHLEAVTHAENIRRHFQRRAA